ncbi:MAG TPA: amino acid deaminase/aldolase [Kineosporiaceae bacterium]|nr:amino acid deaminase/aldolase [Kineosporiaceae bacterium]
MTVDSERRLGPAARLDRATSDLDPPVAVLDLAALRANAADLVRRAGGKPIRLASKSIRCRTVLRQVLAMPGFTGILGYTLAEALWLAEEFDDVVVGYPSVEAAALRRLAADPVLAGRVTLMVDTTEQLDFIDAVVAPDQRPTFRLCLDLDASLRGLGGRIHLGTRRSPVHTPAEAGQLARIINDRPGFSLVGLMAYEGQVAGIGNQPAGRPARGAAVRAMQSISVRELAERRQAAVAAVAAVNPLEFVNGGGTGSLETTGSEAVVTELAAGSGLYGPGLFDSYRSFTPAPAALFALGVSRRPTPDIVTVTGGGWIASGPTGADRSPIPTYPTGLSLLPTEGAGEVQTPLRGDAARSLRIGDRVWFRHAKAGELAEHVDEFHFVEGDAITEVARTYRGEGKNFL